MRAFALIISAVLAAALPAQTILPPYSTSYSFVDLGSAPGVTTPYGGVTFRIGDPDALYVAGGGAVFRIPIHRDGSGHITGFASPGVQYAAAPNIDGGLQFGPGGVLFFTRYRMNELGQIAPGSTTMTRSVPLTPLGVQPSVGGMSFVPAGYPRAEDLKLASYNASTVYTATLTPDGNGTYDVASVTAGPMLGGGGPEGLLYVPPNSPHFTSFEHLLVCEWRTGKIVAFHLDAGGEPEPASRQVFMEDLTGCSGAALDPISGDFVFSTWGGSHQILAVEGFSSPCGRTIHYGTAVAGSAGLAPTLASQGCFARGQTVSLAVSNGFGGAPGVLLAGLGQQNVPVLGVEVLVVPFLGLSHVLGGTPGAPGEGTFSLDLMIPDDSSLLGTNFFFQSVYVDPAGPSGLSATDGIQLNVR